MDVNTLLTAGGFAALVAWLLLNRQNKREEDRDKRDAEREESMGKRITDLENRSFDLTKQVICVVENNSKAFAEFASVIREMEHTHERKGN